MLGYKGSAQPLAALGDALNAGYGYLEVRCLGLRYQRQQKDRRLLPISFTIVGSTWGTLLPPYIPHSMS
jgi:hypothetical protein